MKSLLIVITLFFGIYVHCIGQNLIDQLKKKSISTDQKIAYNTDDRFYGDLIPAVQIAPWKQGYVIAYATFERHARFFFTDQNFQKISSEKQLTNRVIFQIETKNNEIAFLTGSRNVDSDDEISFDFIYFTKVSEQGKILLEKEIVGTDDLNKSKETILDDWGNYNMKWTGKMYMLFFPIQHNFAEPKEEKDIHQGACAYMIKPDGTLYSFFDWNNSHSFEHRIVMTDQHAVLLTKGDASPRGLGVEWYPIDKYYLEEIGSDAEDKDLGHPSLKYYYMYNDEQEYSCDAFTVSGEEGENYVPFSIGSAVVLSPQSILASYSFTDHKNTHDIGLVKVKASNEKCTSGHKFITNTPSICEHSVQLNRIGENRFLMRWKAFSTKGIDTKMENLSDRYIDEDNEEELIFTRHNPDQNKMAIINSKGEFIVKPQTINSKQADWYYNIALKESNTEWHNIMETFAHHTLSESIYTPHQKLVWVAHQHKSNTIDVYVFTP